MDLSRREKENTALKIEQGFEIKKKRFWTHCLMRDKLEARPWTWWERLLISVEDAKERRTKCEQNLENGRRGRGNESYSFFYAKEFIIFSKTE